MSGLLLMRVASMFLGSTARGFTFSAELYGGLLIFVGWVLVDTQQVGVAGGRGAQPYWQPGCTSTCLCVCTTAACGWESMTGCLFQLSLSAVPSLWHPAGCALAEHRDGDPVCCLSGPGQACCLDESSSQDAALCDHRLIHSACCYPSDQNPGHI